MDALLAVPSMSPGGLAAPLSMHFGQCERFTLVALRDGKIEATKVLTTPDHHEGGCMVPVSLLASQGVTAIAAGGMGRGPLLGFLRAGIQLYYAGDHETVQDVVAAFMSDKLPSFGQDACCSHDH